LLTKADKDFINAYHKRVYEMVSVKLGDDKETI